MASSGGRAEAKEEDEDEDAAAPSSASAGGGGEAAGHVGHQREEREGDGAVVVRQPDDEVAVARAAARPDVEVVEDLLAHARGARRRDRQLVVAPLARAAAPLRLGRVDQLAQLAVHAVAADDDARLALARLAQPHRARDRVPHDDLLVRAAGREHASSILDARAERDAKNGVAVPWFIGRGAGRTDYRRTALAEKI